MSRKITWTLSALQDLQEIPEEAYHEPNSVNPLEEKVFQQVALLSDSPELEPIFELFGKPYRHLVIHPNYRLVYLAEERQVFVLAFVHARRNFRQAWREKPRGH